MNCTIEIHDVTGVEAAARAFVQVMGEDTVFALYGNMGVGKTTLIKAVCKELGVEETVTSPTFAIVNEYSLPNGAPVYHFDCYRVEKLEELFDLGFEEYLYSDALCFIEWPELVEPLLPERAIKVTIRERDNGSRVVDINR
ncbi:MAG: tRNA (adenosine(37)-N6)-threonylcarbamoyltransferase complex ATPase subunit type 1 TsaE [Bacteroidota bacterium]|nr:tRNA (adenosine(37)-N6)-threonylcarbamoyltransferase complex ATPase subunit type 1 TsaE [Bacteroidota bacterium]